MPSLGEFQNDKTKRIEAFRKGYLKGTPDLIMLNPNKNYSGLAIEFKSPLHGGITSEFQFDMFDKYKKLGYKVIHSNNYDDIIMAIYDYVKEIRCVNIVQENLEINIC